MNTNVSGPNWFMNTNVKYELTIEWGEWRCLRGWLW